MKAIGRAILSAIFLVLTGLMLAAAKYAPQLVFSFYPAWSRKALAALSSVSALLPIALWEVLAGLAILWLLDRPVSVVLKKELQNIPFLKQVFACLGAYALDRSDPRQGMKVMLQMAEDVKNGRNFIIFPEGTRSRDGNHLLPFKGGSFKCATKANCPIVPVALLDSYKAFDTGSVAKQTVQVHFLDPIYPEEYQGMKTTQIAELVRTRIEEKIQACEMEKTE